MFREATTKCGRGDAIYKCFRQGILPAERGSFQVRKVCCERELCHCSGFYQLGHPT